MDDLAFKVFSLCTWCGLLVHAFRLFCVSAILTTPWTSSTEQTFNFLSLANLTFMSVDISVCGVHSVQTSRRHMCILGFFYYTFTELAP